MDAFVIDRPELGRLIAALQARGLETIGPVVRDGAIVYDRLGTDRDLPIGWTDEQEAGTYRLRRRNDAAVFGYVVGPHSWKRHLFPPRERLWTARRHADGVRFEPEPPRAPRVAFIGVRACELAAIGVQDRVFLEGPYRDPHYAARRAEAFVVAVNCVESRGTCFCASMSTGPACGVGFDLALTELLDDRRHAFLVEVGSDAGREVLDELVHRPATSTDRDQADAGIASAESQQRRRMDATGLRDLMAATLEHPRWDDVAERCLACANCTLVCPTCFCHTVEDATDLSGEHAERWRTWDSCFTLDFTHLHGGAVRGSIRSRYRQWLTHKLGTWHDQFGTSGCVGCGRCITWCPVGIDLVEEVRALREPPPGGASRTGNDGSDR